MKLGRTYEDNPNWEDWIWCRAETTGTEAWVPKQFLQVSDEGMGIFLEDYDARELSVEEGDYLKVTRKLNGFAFAENAVRETGWVPLECLEEIVL